MSSSLLSDPEFELVRQTFLADTLARLAGMERSLELFTRSGDATALEDLVRGGHTLKGDAATVGLEELSQFGERLQRTFESLRGKSLQPGEPLARLLVRSVKLLLELIPQVLSGNEELMAQVAELDDQLASNSAASRPAVAEAQVA